MWQYEYTLKDHLGNTRVTFADTTGNGLIDPTIEIAQINHYYPYGFNMEGNWNGASPTVKNKYQYGDKELQTDFGLNWNDFGARFYDPAIGRWLSPDPLAEKYYRWSPYNYCVDNPINYTDPTGMDAMPGKDKNEAEEYNNQVSKGAEIRSWVNNAMQSKNNSHWDSENGGSEEQGNPKSSFEEKAEALNKQGGNAGLNAQLVEDENVADGSGARASSESGFGSFDAQGFAKAYQKKALSMDYTKGTKFKGVFELWLTPMTMLLGKPVVVEGLPAPLTTGGGLFDGSGVALDWNAMKDQYTNIVSQLKKHGLKLGDGTNGTIPVKVSIQKHKGYNRTSERFGNTYINKIIWRLKV